MDYLTSEELIDRLNDIIRTMEIDEDKFYIALDIAHQLEDEIKDALSDN